MKKEEVDDKSDLNPNLDAIKPNKLVFKYYQPTEHYPQNIPDKISNPGRWVYYNVDLDAVRAQVAKDVHFGVKGETSEQFAEREEFQRLLEWYISKMNNRRPEAGDYDKPEEEIRDAVNIAKMVGRPDPKEDDSDDQEGDVLILDPEKPQKRLADIKFDK